MAASGLRFDRFYSAAPVCSPTRASVLTGRHPNRMGCFKWGYTIRPQEITIAEALKTKGYITGHFGKWHVGPVMTGSPVNPGESGFDEWFSAPNFFDNDPILSREGTAVQTHGESSMVTVDTALGFIEKLSAVEYPFLAVVWFGSPHLPHIAADEDRMLYTDQEERPQNFYGEITGMDRAFGKLRDSLERLGIRENTILWYVSDNGGLPNVAVTGGRGNKGQIYEGGLRVPGIIEWPERITAPCTSNIPCNTADIYPTLLDIAGVAMDGQPPLDGVSLLPLIEGGMQERPKPMGFWDYPVAGQIVPSHQWMTELLEAQKSGDFSSLSAPMHMDAGEIKAVYPIDRFPGHSAWLDWPWKLHRIEGEDGTVRKELYNLAADPDEQHDLTGSQADRTDAMTAELNQWLTSVVHSLNGDDYQ